jgi:hypothetical protein
MPKRKDITGQRIGKLVAKRFGPNINGCTTWICQCDCGNETTVTTQNLRPKHTTSCGCVKKAVVAKGANSSHGMRRTRIYAGWRAMKDRCLNPNNHAYDRYGGRGITICERWMKFENFHQDMGDKPAGLTLDRIDNDGNYEPGNCKWSTPAEQARNRRKRKDGLFQ